MKNNFFYVLAFTVIFLSCGNEGEIAHEESNFEVLEIMSSDQLDLLKTTITSKYKASEIVVSEILKIRKEDRFDVVTFVADGKEIEMGFDALFLEDGISINTNTRWEVYCTGECGCGLEGVITKDGESYLQCTCSECVMHYSSGNRLESPKIENFYVLERAKVSFRSTFNKEPENLMVTKIESEKFDKAEVLTIFYKDDKSEESTFLIVRNYNYGSLNHNGKKSMIRMGGDFEVDCTGSFDCRERFLPDQNAVECTCSPCKMKVVITQNPGN